MALSLSRENNRCEIGYWISGVFEGKGYISDALAALEISLFDIGFNRIEIHCSSLNSKSMSVAKRNSYQLEAYLKQEEIKNGAYRDTLIFAKLASIRTRKFSPFLYLDSIYLFTPNLKASRDWYARLFEVEPYEDLEDYVEFRPNGGVSGLCLHHADTKSPLSSGGSVGYWRVLDFQAAIAHFEKNGAKIYRGPIKIGGGKSICQMMDPIGNVVGLIG
ncbi:MAG: GNAT family N-acetyltransferase [Oligoflexales bacterium]|nr:GNAT family N-acetyltransferase [Oligoflexales bacterium]